MADKNGTQSAVYVSWTTFRNALDTLSQGLPNQIDRSVFPGLSWGVQAQLLAGLKFLGLIDEDGKPAPELTAIAVPDEAARKKALRAVFEKKYADLFALDLKKTTPDALGAKMAESYNVSGATREKAVRFFLSAVDYLDIPLSPIFNNSKRKPGSGTPARRRRRTPRPRQSSPPASTDPAVAISGTSKTLRLKSGGTLTLSASLDLFALNPDDRTFVFGLIDQMESYDQPDDQPDDEGDADGNGADDDPLQ